MLYGKKYAKIICYKIFELLILNKLLLFIVGRFSLKFFNQREKQNKVGYLYKQILFSYFDYKINNYEYAKRNHNPIPKIYIFGNFIALWKDSTSSHLKRLGDLASIYIKNGYEVFFVLSNHPFRSIQSKDEAFFKNRFDHTKSEIKEKINYDLYNISGIDSNFHAIVVNGKEDNFNLKEYVEYVCKLLNTFNLKNDDILFNIGGKYNSYLLTRLLCNIPGKKIYFMNSIDNKFNKDIQKLHDIVIVPSVISFKKYNTSDSEIPIMQTKAKLSPFYWETKQYNNLNFKESELICSLKSYNTKYLILATKRNLSNVISNDYKYFLEKIFQQFDNINVLFIGDDYENISNSSPMKHFAYKENLFTLQHTDKLYSVYCALRNEFDTFYFFPQCSGSGHCNLFAGLAGIPCLFYEGNDAEAYFPKFCFCNDYHEYLINALKLINDSNFKRQYVDDCLSQFELLNAEVDSHYLSFLEDFDTSLDTSYYNQCN